MRRSDLEGLLSILGPVRAAEKVSQACEELGVGEEMTKAEALQVLNRLADEAGLVGMAASFAKSKVHLQRPE